ncbi:MAG: tetratricopeptide repeat protein [Elusimicrobia bacterium]|nr:tetratricopeptide repeat protein [Elusimicrobiota bacterium]
MKRRFWIFLPLSIPLLNGCLATQHDLVGLQAQMDELNLGMQDLKRNQADLSVQMDQLSTQILTLTETLRDSSDRMSRLSGRLDDLQAGLGQKIETVGETFKKEKAKAGIPPPSQIYHQAYLHYVKKNYDLALQGFKNYLESFPEGEMADRAYFYQGESLYTQKKWIPAGEKYSELLTKFPKSDLLPAARLKYALSLRRLDPNNPEARHMLLSITKDFPNSPEASSAKRYLEPPEKKQATSTKSPAPKKTKP